MWALSSQASALSMDFSQAVAKRRQRPSHMKLRSMTHLRGSSSKPWATCRAVDDLYRPASEAHENTPQLRPRIAAIREHVAFSALDPLARIVAGKGRAFRGFHALAVDHTGRRLHIASCREARGRDQMAVDLGQHAIVAPAVGIGAHSRDWRKLLLQKRPGAAGSSKILDRISDPPQLTQLIADQTPSNCRLARATRRRTASLPSAAAKADIGTSTETGRSFGSAARKSRRSI